MRQESALTVDRCEERIASARESDEEGVALGVDLVAAVCVEGCAQQALVIGQDRGVPLAQVLDEPCRALRCP